MITYNFLILFFFAVMGISIFAYVILDGYDLGVGLLLPLANEKEQDLMLSSIAPFWDANETWLVLGIGLLLVAFPMAHGIILSSLYIPIFLMLCSLIIRGCAFDFRLKSQYKNFWTKMFSLGSWGASLSQGFMLGFWLMGFQNSLFSYLFSILISVCLSSGYILLGSDWLLMKMPIDLKNKALQWSEKSLYFTALGVVLVSIVTPLLSLRIFDLWFSLPNFFKLLPIPIITLSLFIYKYKHIQFLKKLIQENSSLKLIWIPFVINVIIFIFAFFGLIFSIFPYLIIDELTIWTSASEKESLEVIFWGVVVVLPIIILYTFFSYKIFFGESKNLEY